MYCSNVLRYLSLTVLMLLAGGAALLAFFRPGDYLAVGYKNSETAQYTNSKAIIRLTAFVCLAKNLQKMEPNNAHT